VGQPRVPQLADDSQPIVDDLLVDLRIAKLDRAVEELGDQQVLPLGVSSTKPCGMGLGRPARCGRAGS
jgi:hypothetical protein